MADSEKIFPHPQFCRDVCWDPFYDWAQPTRIFDQDFGLPPLLEPSDYGWIECYRRRPGTSSWPGYMRPLPFTPSMLAFMQPGHKLLRQLSGGVSEIRTGQGRWRINLDVKQFSPEEITIKSKGNYLEIAGKHEERQDEHGFVSRCFTRKYKVPAEVDLQHISSYLSGDGVLAVEAPLTASITAPSSETVIPIKVEEKPQTVKEDQEEKIKEELKDGQNVEGIQAKAEDGPDEKEGGDLTDPQPPVMSGSEEGLDHENLQLQAPAATPAESPVGPKEEPQPGSAEPPTLTGEGVGGPGEANLTESTPQEEEPLEASGHQDGPTPTDLEIPETQSAIISQEGGLPTDATGETIKDEPEAAQVENPPPAPSKPEEPQNPDQAVQEEQERVRPEVAKEPPRKS